MMFARELRFPHINPYNICSMMFARKLHWYHFSGGCPSHVWWQRDPPTWNGILRAVFRIKRQHLHSPAELVLVPGRCEGRVVVPGPAVGEQGIHTSAQSGHGGCHHNMVVLHGFTLSNRDVKWCLTVFWELVWKIGCPDFVWNTAVYRCSQQKEFGWHQRG